MDRKLFDFNVSDWWPVKDKAVLERCRNIKREEMEITNENGYSIRVVPHPSSAVACELFDRIYKSDVEDKKTVIVFPNSWRNIYTSVAEMCNKFNVSACWWLPVVLNNFTTKLFNNLSEALKSDIDDVWFFREKFA